MPADSLDLQRRASALRAEANALSDAYRRRTWWRFTLVFFPVPFVLVLLRLDIEAWHYFVFGGAYLGLSALLYAWDTRASDKCSAAERLAEAAEKAASVSGASTPSRAATSLRAAPRRSARRAAGSGSASRRSRRRAAAAAG